MSILIKGMEMPKSCWRCALSQLYEKPREMLICKITHEEVLRHKIDSNCPLVPVPPHGDLIDRKALLADTTDMLHSMMVFGGARVYTSDAIKNAPTIIPADPAEEENHG